MKKTRRSDNRPSFQFYPRDWLNDFALRACSLEAKGLWIDILCLMWDAEQRGELRMRKNAKLCPMNAKDIAKVLAQPYATVRRALRELVSTGVAEKAENGTVYNRRMAREQQARDARSHAGRHAATMRWSMRKHGSSSSSSTSTTKKNTDCTPSQDSKATQESNVSEVCVPDNLIQDFGRLKGGVSDLSPLHSWCDMYDASWIEQAVTLGVERGKGADYVGGILRRWAAQGGPDKPTGQPKEELSGGF